MRLSSLLVLATFVTACNAACFFLPPKMPEAGEPEGCKDDDGKYPPIKSSWRNPYCEDCFCEKNQIACCDIVALPINYDKENCQVIYRQENCIYSVVESKNPEKSCEVHGWGL